MATPSTKTSAHQSRKRLSTPRLLDAPPVAQPEPDETPVPVEHLVWHVELRGPPVLAPDRHMDDAPARAVGSARCRAHDLAPAEPAPGSAPSRRRASPTQKL